MIRITTKNLKNRRKMVKEAIAWYADRLLGKRLARNISIHVIGHDSLISDEYNGLCMWTDPDPNMSRLREFEIELNLDLDDKTLLTVIAHEMVHVKQWARAEMREVFAPFYINGYKAYTVRAVKFRGVIVGSDVTYYDFPWEKEAYGMEKQLYKEYKNANR